MKELTWEEREKIATKLEERHGEAIEAASRKAYDKEPAAIGIALTYFDCGCLLLRSFDESGDIIGDPAVVDGEGSCTVDHLKTLEDPIQTGAYNSILWKDAPEEFDRKYGNEKRIDIARKLFPPQEEEKIS